MLTPRSQTLSSMLSPRDVARVGGHTMLTPTTGRLTPLAGAAMGAMLPPMDFDLPEAPRWGDFVPPMRPVGRPAFGAGAPRFGIDGSSPSTPRRSGPSTPRRVQLSKLQMGEVEAPKTDSPRGKHRLSARRESENVTWGRDAVTELFPDLPSTSPTLKVRPLTGTTQPPDYYESGAPGPSSAGAYAPAPAESSSSSSSSSSR